MIHYHLVFMSGTDYLSYWI